MRPLAIKRAILSGVSDPLLFSYTSGGSTAGATFSRTSTAYRTNSVGQIVEARANYLTRSDEFDHANWVMLGAGVSLTGTNSATAPSGANTAETFTSATGATNGVYQIAAVAPTRQYTTSFYAKLGTLAAGDFRFAVYDETNAAFIATGIVPNVALTSAAWNRVTYAFTTPANCVSVRIYPYRNNPAVSGTFLLASAQLEPGAVATDYMATTASPYYALRDNHYVGGVRTTLLEGSRTNLLLRSQEFDNGIWTKVGTTITANATTAPDGTVTADLATSDGTATESVAQSVTVVSGTAYTASVDVKPSVGTWVRLQFDDTGSNGVRVWANLATGTLGTSSATGAGWTLGGATITSAANGFFRVTVTGTTSGTAARVFVATASADASTTKVNGNAHYLWQAGLEAGAFASTRIPTTSATVTRAADSLSFPFTHPPQEMSVYVRGYDAGNALTPNGSIVTTGGGTPRFDVRRNFGLNQQNAIWLDGVSNSNSVATLAITQGDLVETIGQLSATRAVTAIASLNGGAAVTGATGVAGAASNVWGSNTLTVGSGVAFRDIVIVKGTRDMSYMRSRVAP